MPAPKLSEADTFYAESVKILNQQKVPFLVGGTYAINAYTGTHRPTKDLDIFCKAGDYLNILATFRDLGYTVGVDDERWLAHVKKEKHYFDVIFGSQNAATPVTNDWFKESFSEILFGQKTPLIPPTELIWLKIYVQMRNKFDGADVAHLILKQSANIDWHRLLAHMEQHWELLLMTILNFRFVYPTERESIPGWLIDELLNRLQTHRHLPTPTMKVCRGRLLSLTDYAIDVKEWEFADVVGGTEQPV